jgi:hypothetical protein
MLKPLPKDGWNYATAAHRLNRAGFGGPPEKIARLTDLGPDAALASLLDYEKIPDPTPNPARAVPDPGHAERLRAMQSMTPEARRQAQQAEERAHFGQTIRAASARVKLYGRRASRCEPTSALRACLKSRLDLHNG